MAQPILFLAMLYEWKIYIHTWMHTYEHIYKPTYHQTFNLVILFITIAYTRSNLLLLQNGNNAPKTAHMKVHNYFSHLNAFKRIKSGCKHSISDSGVGMCVVVQVLIEHSEIIYRNLHSAQISKQWNASASSLQK